MTKNLLNLETRISGVALGAFCVAILYNTTTSSLELPLALVGLCVALRLVLKG